VRGVDGSIDCDGRCRSPKRAPEFAKQAQGGARQNLIAHKKAFPALLDPSFSGFAAAAGMECPHRLTVAIAAETLGLEIREIWRRPLAGS